MSSSSRPVRQGALAGTASVLVAESLALPTGFAVAAILTRSLGPADYGGYATAATVIGTLEWILIALLIRPTIKFVAEAADWKPVAATSFRVYVGVGTATGALVWALATPTASLLRDPAVGDYLRLFAVEIPIFAAATAYRGILTGLARYRQQALASAGRWLSRLALVALFVGVGWGVNGAILGNIGAVVVTAVVGLSFVGPSVFGGADFPRRQLFQLAVPTFLLSLSVRLFDRVGLLALKTFGGTPAEAGFYGAAQNLLVLAGIVNVSVTPILISTVAAGRRDGDEEGPARAATLALRLGLWTFPLAAVVAGASGEVVDLLFGSTFADAAPLVTVLIVGAGALVLIALASGLLVALGRPWPGVMLTAPILPLAVAAHFFIVPRAGALGAALVTTISALAGAFVCVVVVCVIWPLRAPVGSLAKSAAISVVAYAASASWSTPGALVVVKVLVLSLAVLASASALRELTWSDLGWIRTARGKADQRTSGGA